MASLGRAAFVLTLLLAHTLAFLPRRSSAEITYIIQEELPVGTVFGHVIKDADLDLRYSSVVLATLRFRFLTRAPSCVSLEEHTGRLRTSARVDRDALCRGLDACALRLDLAVLPMTHFQIIKVAVEILEVNDHAPVFVPDSLRVELNEASGVGWSLALPDARDEDSGLLGVQTYRLTKRGEDSGLPSRLAALEPQVDYFRLEIASKLDGSTELRLVLARPLDRERAGTHRLTVIAYDGGDPPRSGALLLTVTVSDANDNAPIFDCDHYDAKARSQPVLSVTYVRVTLGHKKQDQVVAA